MYPFPALCQYSGTVASTWPADSEHSTHLADWRQSGLPTIPSILGGSVHGRAGIPTTGCQPGLSQNIGGI